MRSRLALLLRYFAYKGKSVTRYGVHSPFVYEFIEKILRDKTQADIFVPIENLRRQLLKNKNTINIEDYGAGSLLSSGKEKKISEIARTSPKPKKQAQLLFRITQYFAPENILELGTSLGISTAYLAIANPKAKIITIEGSPEIAKVAQQNFDLLQLNNIRLIARNFDEVLEKALQDLSKLDMAFIDGNHRREPVLRYFQQCLPYTHNDSLLIFDDIHWTEEMEEAWEEIKAHPDVTLTIDLFFFGFIFFKKEFKEKQNFVLRF